MALRKSTRVNEGVAIGSQHFVRELTNICVVVTLMACCKRKRLVSIAPRRGVVQSWPDVWYKPYHALRKSAILILYRDHSAIPVLEAAQTYCRYIGVLALGVLRVLRIYVAEGTFC